MPRHNKRDSLGGGVTYKSYPQSLEAIKLVTACIEQDE